MNFPDAYGQYYHPTPTPQNAYGYNPTESVVNSKNEYSNLDYYYQTSEVRKKVKLIDFLLLLLIFRNIPTFLAKLKNRTLNFEDENYSERNMGKMKR